MLVSYVLSQLELASSKQSGAIAGSLGNSAVKANPGFSFPLQTHFDTKPGYRARDLFVPERFLIDMSAPARRPGVLWRSFRNFLPKVASVSLGAARAAIDYAVDAIEQRVEQPSGHSYKNNARVQSVIVEKQR
ncbi:MAG TPA: hypothetical protein VGI36_16200 [Candidatus Binataceae bacterium]|jgi:hypothetical protein